MAQQEEGWPLGLQPLNDRIGLARNPDHSGSMSFNTLISASSPSISSDSSSDLDTESTGSFFHDKSITLGSLIGVPTSLERSRRSRRSGRGRRPTSSKSKTINCKKKATAQRKSSESWLFSICLKHNTDAAAAAAAAREGPSSSLGHFLAAERRAAAANCAPDELAVADLAFAEAGNSLFVDGCVAPPRRSTDWEAEGADDEGKEETAGVSSRCFGCNNFI